MAKVYEFLADGFEEIEALAPVDILRRGGVEVRTVSIMGREDVIGAHNVTVKADIPLMLRGMVSGPLGDAVEKIADVLATVPYV